MDVLRFTPDEISSMVGRYKSARKYGSPMNFSTSETNKARQQAHIVTQGSGDLPYMPLWLGTGWAKPLSLFYRVAYRMTDSVAKNIVIESDRDSDGQGLGNLQFHSAGTNVVQVSAE